MQHRAYTVGWIVALPIEAEVAIAMLDERHSSLHQPAHDHNNYTLGRIGPHNVVLAPLPIGVMGVTSAAVVATQMSSTYPSLRFGLMVGIGGGIPSEEHDIRLGDVVVSKPDRTSGGVIQYDFGKTVQEGRFMRMGSLKRPPDVLLTAVASLQAKYGDKQEASKHLLKILGQHPTLSARCKHPGSENDQLFKADYDHPPGLPTCAKCDVSQVVTRSDRGSTGPSIHYGLIASGNQVMKDGVTRERLRKELNVMCFEMEAAGLMDRFPCLVVRGICDYADSHKNKIWQPHAAAAAAAYAKELLCMISECEVERTLTVVEGGNGADVKPSKSNHVKLDNSGTITNMTWGNQNIAGNITFN